MTVHIVGMGISGLSAAFYLTKSNVDDIALYDAAARPGGRCHSFFDKKLNALIDNGTHLMLGANKALLEMLDTCPSPTPLKKCGNDITFFKKDGSFFRINTAHPFRSMLKMPVIFPLLCESVMNTPVRQADMSLFFKTALKCFGKNNGEIRLADPSLSDCVIKPVVDFLKNKNVSFNFSKRLLEIKNKTLFFAKSVPIELNSNDKVILATDPENLSRLLPTAKKMPFQTIVNIHYKARIKPENNPDFAGLVGMTAHWFFIKRDILSVTISAANSLMEKFSPDTLACLVWNELSPLLNLPKQIPDYRIICEKRATVLQTKAVNRLRLKTDIGSDFIFLAGDTTKTGLPCTMEGSVRSGYDAARAVRNALNKR